MNTHVDKTQENKSQSISALSSEVQNSGESTFQFVDNRPETIAQRKLQEMANNSPKVSQLRAFQKMMSLDDVKVYSNSGKPDQLQAHAYAQGSNIHLAPGQEKHLPHEAWHVVQQEQGRVKPTVQMKGKVNIDDDVGLEKEADVMGGKSLQTSSFISSSKSSHQLKKIGVAQRVPAFPNGSINNGLYSVSKITGLNFVNNAMLYGNALVGRPHSNVPLELHMLQIVDDSGQALVSKHSTEATTTIVHSDFSQLSDGLYWVRGVARSLAGTTLYNGFQVEVRSLVPEGGIMIGAPIVGSTYLGSHWTSSTYNDSFRINGIQNKGEAQARFGEGLYITSNADYGWKAAMSKIQEIGSGNVSEMAVFLRPGQALKNEFDGQYMNGQFTNPPWTGNKDLDKYITNYDTIYDTSEKEIKFNSRAFGKINIVWMGDFNPVTRMPI